MAIDLFSSAVLNRVVQDLKVSAPSLFFLNTFFPEISVSDQEEIFFDVLTGKPRLAPFVSPFVEGQVVRHLGYETKSFKPAYVKDKRVFEDGRPVRRAPGEPISAPLDAMARRQRLIAQDTVDQIAMIQRRMEWMAAQVLLTGQVTVSGEKYPTTVVNFGRDAALTVTLTGTALWSDAASTPLSDLETFSGYIRTKSGANAVDVVMAQNVYTAFRGKADVAKLVDQSAGLDSRTSLNLGPDMSRDGATYKGQIGDFRLWVYTETYTDESGSSVKFLPDNYLVMASSTGLEGVRHFGAIKDEAAGFQPLDYFQKSWTQPDPAVRYLMMQSAPLVVPYRPNASLAAKVL